MTSKAFALLTFFAAFLLFAIEPLTGKIILPMIGGAPQGWLVTLSFFQTTLVGGYGLVYLSRKLPGLWAGVLFALLLAAGYALYDANAQFTLTNDTYAAFDLFAWLWRSYGFSIMALSAMAPLTQRLFAQTHPDNPYTLYAISNAGSFLGLLSYPLAIERWVDLPVQMHAWVMLYALLIPVLLVCAYQAKGRAIVTTQERIAPATYGWWLLFAALPASMLSGVTSYITSDVMSLPLLWVIPLALYLATYIAAFSDHATKHLSKLTLAFGIAAPCLIALSALGGLAHLPCASVILLGTFTIGAYLCHLRLYGMRPHAGNLPLFYLVIATGGALGGAFNAFLAPFIFPYSHEFFFVLAIVVVLVPPFGRISPELERLTRIAAGTCVLAAIVAPHMALHAQIVVFGIIIFCALALLVFAPRLLLACFTVCLVFNTTQAMVPWREISHIRNFFGVLHVQDIADGRVRVLIHGRIMHGVQSRDKSTGLLASYYLGAGPVKEAIAAGGYGPDAVIGLGVGQLSAYATPSRKITFYEIDPDVVHDAQDYFTFLKDNNVHDIVLGDGRLSLAASSKVYKGIILDAFSSDAIPAHLLTQEAIAMYRAHLRPDGYLLFHISNRHLHLAPILEAQAQSIGWTGLNMYYKPPADMPFAVASQWFVMTQNKNMVKTLENQGWGPVAPSPYLWRDGRFSVLDALF